MVVQLLTVVRQRQQLVLYLVQLQLLAQRQTVRWLRRRPGASAGQLPAALTGKTALRPLRGWMSP